MEQSPGRLAEHLYTAPPCKNPNENDVNDDIGDTDGADVDKGSANLVYLVYAWLFRVCLGSSNK